MPNLTCLETLLLVCLAGMLRLSACENCWPQNISLEPAIGFDLGLTYGYDSLNLSL